MKPEIARGWHDISIRSNVYGLTHLCFVDDIMVFSDGHKRSMEEIITVLMGLLLCRDYILVWRNQRSI